jgi:predicted signal transduction protein with EAL and GGDEF domain
VAARIHAVVHPSDTVARLGGDEFAVLLPDAGESRAVQVTKAILAAIDAPLVLEGQILRVGASLGIALYPDHGADGSTLLRCADVAMYVAKRAQSDYALYAYDSDQHSPARLQLLTDLRETIAGGGLELHYQPLVDMRDRSIKSIEALVRWPHPIHGMLSPDQFIPLAEQTGLIVPLTHWILEDAVRQCKVWQQLGSSPLAVSVNLSARTLHDTELPDTVAAVLRAHDLCPNQLTVEITETGLMTDPARSLQVVSRLAEMGVNIAIDDFGTGYSSLAYLKNLPVDVLKVDRSFVRGLGKEENQKDIAIVRSIIAMAHLLRLQVVAEGVETPEELALLHGLGCDMAQGYYVSRPLNVADFEEWMQMTPWRRGASLPTSIAGVVGLSSELREGWKNS